MRPDKLSELLKLHVTDGNNEKAQALFYQKQMQPIEIQEAFDIFKLPKRNARRKFTSTAISRFLGGS